MRVTTDMGDWHAQMPVTTLKRQLAAGFQHTHSQRLNVLINA
jgi:hypothetical protein